MSHEASLEDVGYQAVRGLDRGLFLKLGSCDWIRSKRNLLISGPCGMGKSFLAKLPLFTLLRYQPGLEAVVQCDSAIMDGRHDRPRRVLIDHALLHLGHAGRRPDNTALSRSLEHKKSASRSRRR